MFEGLAFVVINFIEALYTLNSPPVVSFGYWFRITVRNV